MLMQLGLLNFYYNKTIQEGLSCRGGFSMGVLFGGRATQGHEPKGVHEPQ
jgi:hypothetical protein